MDEASNEIAKEAVSQTAGAAYSDLLQPTMKSFGNTLSLFPRTIGVWLGRWEKWIINGEKSIELTKQAVIERVQKIPEEKLSEPEANIAIPAIQQLSYCYDCEELRNMYANLLTASMCIDTKSNAHPAFVDIIKQLTPDEAKLIKLLKPDTKQFYPIIDITSSVKGKDEYVYVIKNFSDISYGICAYPDNISAYLDNFERLGLIEIHDSIFLVNEKIYDNLKEHAFVKNVTSQPLPENHFYDFINHCFSVTNFGINFIKACVIDIFAHDQ